MAAALLLRSPHPGRDTGDQRPLIVGDGRVVELINLNEVAAAPGAALADRIAADLPEATVAVEEFWGRDWARRIVVIITGSEQDFAAEAGNRRPGGWSGVAAVAVADRVDPARGLATGQRIVFAPGAAAMTQDSLRLVLTHELFHYASRADTALDAPRWLTEGVADFIARGNRAAPRPPEPIMLPSDAELDSGESSASIAYDRAWWFAYFVAERYGTDALRRLYGEACGPGHSDVRSAVRRTLGAELPTVLADWREWPGPVRPGDGAR